MNSNEEYGFNLPVFIGSYLLTTLEELSFQTKKASSCPHGAVAPTNRLWRLGVLAAGILPFAERLTGVDLSRGMLEIARERKIYDELIEAELTEYLGRSGQRFDLIISADTLIYSGDLAGVISAAAGALRPGGRFVFTLESVAEEQATRGFQLQGNGRYRHSQSYVSRMMQHAGLDLISISECVLRKEWLTSVMGWLVVGRKSRSAEPLLSAL